MAAVASLVAYAAAMLAADRFVGLGGQTVLGVVTAAVLIAACRALSVEERLQVVGVVLVATCFEVIGSVLLGLYRYRLGNLPLFVPPGHGLVYVTGLYISRLGPVTRHERGFVRLALALGAVWGALGLSGVLGRVDMFGAVGVLWLSIFLLRGPAPTVYAAVSLVVAWLEWYGTALGTWRWAAELPGIGIPDGNPPSGAASGYVLFDILAMALVPLAVAAGRRTAGCPPDAWSRNPVSLRPELPVIPARWAAGEGAPAIGANHGARRRTARPMRGSKVSLLNAGDDKALLARVAQADPEAFEALYARYSGPEYSIAMGMLA